jgi:hypothetical protein
MEAGRSIPPTGTVGIGALGKENLALPRYGYLRGPKRNPESTGALLFGPMS